MPAAAGPGSSPGAGEEQSEKRGEDRARVLQPVPRPLIINLRFKALLGCWPLIPSQGDSHL